MPMQATPPSDECQAPRKRVALQTSRRFAIQLRKYHACSPAGCMRIQLRSSPLQVALDDNTGRSDCYVPAALFSPVSWHKSACGPAKSGGICYSFSSEHLFDPCSLHPRAYAREPLRQLIFQFGRRSSKALRQFPTFAQRLLWHRWPIFGL